jgi:hypothetical protein
LPVLILDGLQYKPFQATVLSSSNCVAPTVSTFRRTGLATRFTAGYHNSY